MKRINEQILKNIREKVYHRVLFVYNSFTEASFMDDKQLIELEVNHKINNHKNLLKVIINEVLIFDRSIEENFNNISNILDNKSEDKEVKRKIIKV